ncbi:hypothetical protein GCM10011386_38240 [Parapedobacter defluvii]|uniref:T4 beta protein n=1 Tax=Parapedobacter defluvii TaxID=2045106 RepID=A0ABQ1ML52_9SPHI|nr:beta family protein [Parapedobacter defluvii]GGC42388.1 hypothetical protein GCM10011386_38240 [Parapedobacter defluvii]
MNPEFYLPILKSKEGEFTALFKLDKFTKKHICPLFEISNLEYDNESKKNPKTLEEHLHGFCLKKFIKKWCSSNSFVDTYQLRGQFVNGITPLEYIYEQIAKKLLIPLFPMPIAHINDNVQTMNGLISVIKKHGIKEIGIRLKIEDAMDITLANKLDGLLKRLELNCESCHLIFDLASSDSSQPTDFSQPMDFSAGIIALLETFPNFHAWKSFTICGGAFPRSDLLKKGLNIVTRLDWELYRHIEEGLRQTDYARKINFGDYSIVTPGHFEFDPRKMKRSANIRYTTGGNWLIIKGSALSKPDDFKQYISQAGEICTSEYYLGESYSEGDLYIRKCYLGDAKPGNPTVWNWVGNNHHFTKVVADLFSTPVYS